MRSKKIEFRLPWNLYDRSLQRTRAHNFRNYARYLTTLILEDTVAPRQHFLSKAIAEADPEVQDTLIDGILDIEPERMRHILHKAIKIHNCERRRNGFKKNNYPNR